METIRTSSSKTTFRSESIAWIGKAVGVNRWHGATGRGGHARIYEMADYLSFKQSLAMTIRSRMIRPFLGDVHVMAVVSLGTTADTDGVSKPIGDAIQLSGLVEDDNQIQNIVMIRRRHKRGEQDVIMLIVWGESW